MNETQRQNNRIQLAECLESLADRAEQLDERMISTICGVASALIEDGSENLLAAICAEIARQKLEMIDEAENMEDDENEEDME